MTEHIKNPFFWIAHMSPIWVPVVLALTMQLVFFIAGGDAGDLDSNRVTVASMTFGLPFSVGIIVAYWWLMK